MQKTVLHVSLTVNGPLLTQSSNPGNLGLDAVVARDHRNRAYLPGTLVSGKIRQALEELLDATRQQNQPTLFTPDLANWLGEGDELETKTKRLYFSDFVLDGEESTSSVRYRIAIDAERGSVGQHQLLMIESPFASGKPYTFNGQIHFFSTAKTAETITQHLNAGLKWLSHVGAFRSIGFGQVLSAELNKADTQSITDAQLLETTDAPDRVGLLIQPDYPFCLGGKTPADNLFASDAIISGASIKGCIATTWNHLLDKQSSRVDQTTPGFAELRSNFSKLRFLHAFPSRVENRRPVVAPLSLVKIPEDNDNTLYDVAQLTRPCLVNGEAPAFAVDWKDSATTLDDYPWPYVRFADWGWDNLDVDLRIRTAIDRRTLRSADDRLFAYEHIIPENKRWYSELDLSAVSKHDRGDVLAQLKALCSQGLIGLGKTKTPIAIEFSDVIPPVVESHLSPVDDHLWLLTLQTDALLGSPEGLQESSGKDALHAMYARAWNELSDGQLTLSHYFARQRLAGGKYLRQTMQRGEASYRPWLLTEAGSIFVLKGHADRTAEVQNLLEHWLHQGLPLTGSAGNWYRLGDDRERYWQFTPFVPENGYGEIAVNLDHATIKRLTDQDESVTLIEGIEGEKS